MEKEEKKIIKHSFGLLFVSVLSFTLLMIGGSYAYMRNDVANDGSGVKLGVLKVSYKEGVNDTGDIIELSTNYPSTDTEGLTRSGYQFTLTNTSNHFQNYAIQVVNDEAMIKTDGCEDTLMPLSLLRYNVNDSAPRFLSDTEKENYILKRGTLGPNESEDFQIRLWVMDGAAENITLNQHYHGKLVIQETN